MLFGINAWIFCALPPVKLSLALPLGSARAWRRASRAASGNGGVSGKEEDWRTKEEEAAWRANWRARDFINKNELDRILEAEKKVERNANDIELIKDADAGFDILNKSTEADW